MNDLNRTLIDIARAGSKQPALKQPRVIAGFASARDARTFAGLKRDQGEDVTVEAGNPDSPYQFVVRTVVRSL